MSSSSDSPNPNPLVRTRRALAVRRAPLIVLAIAAAVRRGSGTAAAPDVPQ